MRTAFHAALSLASISVFFGGACAAAQSLPRIDRAVDESALVTLRNTVHPLARPENDLGPADEAVSGRMLLLLRRSPEQDKALRQLLDEQQTAGSPNFHKWLTPDEFGEKYGVADADIETVAGYLSAHGFQVGRTYKNKMAIEVTGTAAQLREAFHSEIHRYAIGGHEFYANATEQRVPAALAPVVAGFASLNNINRTLLTEERPASIAVTVDGETHKVRPLYYDSAQLNPYVLVPADIQKIYNIPVTTTGPGAGGKGVTVGVIGDSQIDLQVIKNYQTLGGGGTTTPTEIVDGEDPTIFEGTLGSETLAEIELELIGAAAPYANLNYYVAASTSYDDGLNFALIRAVEDNAVQVLNHPFAVCEANLTAPGNGLIEAAWMQAAAQGITVITKTGNTGSAGCDTQGSASSSNGLAVNGYASTPYDTAVGGTDFYYAGNPETNYWNNSSGTNGVSAKGYIPEKAWDNSINTNNVVSISKVQAGGGGLSSAGSTDGVTTGPYGVPSWQAAALSAAGISGGARAIPDVAMFAGSGANHAIYGFCIAPTDCSGGAGGYATMAFAGGTTGGQGVFTGIMADVIAKQSGARQGNANPTLYSLQAGDASRTAANKVFNDITVGTNSVACTAGTGCSGGYLKVNGNNAYNAGTGYDAATGLGSVNATNLINDWAAPASKTSTTTLTVTNWSTGQPVTASVVHGTPLNLKATVTGSGGTPTGSVAFDSSSGLPSDGGIIAESLSSGVATAADLLLLPGGTYDITANYGGDATFQPSVSAAQSITVTPEPTQLLIVPNTTGWLSSVNSSIYASGSSVPFGTEVALILEPFSSTNNNNVYLPTGSVSAYSTSTATVPALVVPLGAEGTATIDTTQLSGGSYSWSFRYSGDASYQSSTCCATPYTLTVTQAATTTSLAVTTGNAANTADTDAPLTLTATVTPTPALALATGIAPSGSVGFYNSSNTLLATATLAGGMNSSNQPIGVAAAQLSTAKLGSGATVTAKYLGDSNYLTSTSAGTALSTKTNYTGDSGLTISFSSTSALSNTTAALGSSISVYVTATETTPTITPSGSVQFYVNSVASGSTCSITSGSQTTCTLSLAGVPAGTATVTAVFVPANTSHSPSSTTTGATVTVTNYTALSGDFALATDTVTQTITNASNVVLFAISTSDLANMAATNAPVTLTCTAPGGLICTLGTGGTSSTTITLGSPNAGTVVTQLAVSGMPSGGTGALRAPVPAQRWWLAGGGPALACVLLLGIPARRKGLRGMLAVLICVGLVAGPITGCGGNAASLGHGLTDGNLLSSDSSAVAKYTSGLATNQVPSGSYTVIVTGTATTSVIQTHNISVNVIVGDMNSLAFASNTTHTLTVQGNQLLLTDPGASTAPNKGLVQNAADGTNDQNWKFVYQTNGYYLIQNAAPGNGLYLTAPSTVGQQVTQASATGSGTQLWTLSPVGDGYEVVNAASGCVLDGGSVYTTTAGTAVACNTQNSVASDFNQAWYIQ